MDWCDSIHAIEQVPSKRILLGRTKETGYEKTGKDLVGTLVSAIKTFTVRGDIGLGTRTTKAESCKSTKDDAFDSIG